MAIPFDYQAATMINSTAGRYRDGRFWFSIKNTLSVAIPPRSIVGILNIDREKIYVGYPQSDSDKLVLVTSDKTILSTGTGEATWDWPWWITFDSNDGALVRGDRWGPQAGSFKLRKNKIGFLAIPMKDSGPPPATEAGYFGLEYCR